MEPLPINLIDAGYGRFLVCPWETIGQEVGSGAFWEPFLLPVFDRCASPTASVIEIGSNQGFHTVYLSPRYRKVYAFEAQKWVYWLLCGNLALNLALNVETYNLAALDRETELSMVDEGVCAPSVITAEGMPDYPRLHNFSSIGFQPGNDIRSVRIDSIVPEDVPIALIKSDAQGSDLRAIQGCQKLIDRWRPTIIFEFESIAEKTHGDSFETYMDYFRQLDYHVSALREGLDYLCEPN